MNRKEAMAEVCEVAMTDAGRSFRKLVGVCIQELRIKNDTADAEEFKMNQGAIRELKAIHKGIGPKIRASEFEKTIDYDGAFGA